MTLALIKFRWHLMPHCKNFNNPSHCLERNCETLRPWRQNLPRVKSPPLSRNNWRRLDFVFVFVFTFVFVFEPEQLERVRFCRFSPLWRRFLVKLCFPRSPGKLMWWRRLQPWRRWWRRRRLPSSPTHAMPSFRTKILTHKFISHFSERWHNSCVCEEFVKE